MIEIERLGVEPPQEQSLHEKDISAKQLKKEEEPRFPLPHGHAGREKGAQTEKGQGAEEVDGHGAAEVGAVLKRGVGPRPFSVMSQAGERFPKRARLTRRSEFLRLSREGRRIHTPHFVVLSKANDQGETRLGVTVSSRVGNAVVRNRIKRRLRDFFRRHRREIPSPQDIVIIARKGADEIPSEQIVRELRGALIHGRSRPR